MEMDERIPNLSDDELETLYANAMRLAQSDTPRQREQAERLLPLLNETREARLKARAQEQAERRRESAQRKTSAARGAKRKS
jgi:hypothetical protein